MSDITMNNEESQNKNQKTTPVTESHFELNDPRISLFGLISKIWLGWSAKLRTPPPLFL